MYSLDINFLNDRPDYRQTDKRVDAPKKQVQIGEMTPLILGVIVGLLLPGLVGGAWFWLTQENSKLNEQIAQIDTQLQSLQAEKNKVTALNTQIKEAKDETAALVTVFNTIKPWSAILQDIRERIPVGVQIQTIEQTETETKTETEPTQEAEGQVPLPVINLEISGTAKSFDEVNNFLLTLQQSSFLEEEATQIVSAELISNPTQLEVPDKDEQDSAVTVTYELPKVVDYTIKTSLTNIPAAELLREIDRKGGVGLVARLKAIEHIEQNQPIQTPTATPSPTETTTE